MVYQPNLFVFDIETVPDITAGRKILGLDDSLSDADIAQAMFKLRREQNGSNFLAHHLHRIVAISCVLRSHDQVKVWSLGEANSTESELIQRFFAGIEKFTPILVSWNGSGFDLPVIHYRSLIHGIASTCYWETGDDNQPFRWNNYLNRFHERHTDLMDVLGGYQGRTNAPLDQMATLCGFPGKMGMSGAHVWEAYQANDIQGIRDYCETDVLNTYLLYMRYQLIRGKLSSDQYDKDCETLKETLAMANKPHFEAFVHHWQSGE